MLWLIYVLSYLIFVCFNAFNANSSGEKLLSIQVYRKPYLNHTIAKHPK